MTDVTTLGQAIGERLQITEKNTSYPDKTFAIAQKRSPITLLPSDILRHIFEYVTLSLEGYHRLPWELEWMQSTAHVCAFWRCVALDHAALWTHIDLNLPTWIIEEKLKRSKVAPLTITIDMSRLRLKDLGYVWEHTSRIHDLSILSESDYRNAWSPVLVQNTLPDITAIAENLENFSLTFRQGDRPDDSLPLNIFAGGTPKLRRLKLKRCDLNWGSPFLAGLTTLSLDKPGSKTGKPSLIQLIDALETMDNLETLVLHNTLPLAVSDSISNSHRTRTLPRLVTIDIISTTLECTQLLNNFKFPSIAHAKFKLNSKASEVLLHYPSIVTHISSLGVDDGLFLRHPIRSIDCQYPQDYHWLEIALWDTCNDHSYRYPKCTPRLQLSLRISDYFPRLWQVEVLNSFSKILPLEEVESLSLSQLPSLDWTLCIDRFKSLQWLCACDTRTSFELLEDLCPRKNTPLHREEILLSLPTLKGLVIEGCIFTGAERRGSFDNLLHCLKVRVQLRHSLTDLRLIHCEITGDQISELKKYVCNVVIG